MSALRSKTIAYLAFRTPVNGSWTFFQLVVGNSRQGANPSETPCEGCVQNERSRYHSGSCRGERIHCRRLPRTSYRRDDQPARDETQWKVSPGTRAVALIINMLGQRRPLYRVWESFTPLDLPVLFDEPVELDDLNDDGFGRTLDRLHASGELRRLVSSVALRATHRLPLGVRSIHADTTSISVAGQYEPTTSDQDFLEANTD